ncbi:MAG: GNAT family N-acetyltransferase [Myxococcales bacterium]|nr:GNAT family N-acetyltransferase [Myxococcales bacterium]
MSDVSGLQRHASTAVTRGAPTLVTERLTLRALRLDDAAAVADGAGDKRVARYLIAVPTPYPLALARRWLQGRIDWWAEDRGVTLAITRRTQTRQLLGTVSLRRHAHRAELGYWLAANAWNFGFATEACRALVEYGFRDLDLQRIYAQVIAGNTASQHVLDKLGMACEGTKRQHLRKGRKLHDVVLYGLLRDEWSSPTDDDA